MCELKIKAWLKTEEKIVDVQMIDFQNKEVYWLFRGHLQNKESFDDVELIKSTGLLDKNGNEVFEGDILTSEHYPFQDEGKYNYHGVVEWIDEYASYYITKRLANKNKRGISDGISEPLMDFDISEFAVIGNIYENPELVTSYIKEK